MQHFDKMFGRIPSKPLKEKYFMKRTFIAAVLALSVGAALLILMPL